MSIRVPLFDLDYDEQETLAVNAVLESRWLTMGDRTRQFEERFADYVGADEAIAVSSCTAGLHLGLQALGIGAGDEVICPSLTFIATANAIRYCGATPVFADIDSLRNPLVSAETLEPLITERTRALCVVHYAGYSVDMDSVQALADRHGLKVMEDAAHAPGTTYKGRPIGSIGDVTAFSFFSNKNLSTGEGGMVSTNDADMAEQMRRFRSHAMTTQTLDRHRGHAFDYDVIGLGFNYRMTEIEAALGLAQLDKLDRNNVRRADLVARYHERLSGVDGLIVPFADAPAGSSYHIMPVLLPEGTDRGAVRKGMIEEGVQTSVHYIPLHRFSTFDGLADYSHLSNTDAFGERVITLPLYPTMTDDQLDLVVDSLARQLV